jgi:crotonobetainyl-CoA:carnitine CoA-transferase CaiB-like acyl-CoA transferase
LIYETRDGHMTVAVMSDKEWANLTRAFERPEWLEDPRFKTPALRDQNINARLAMIQEVLRTRTTAEWMARLEAADVPCAPALTRSEVIEHPQVLASEILLESDHPVAGRLRQTRAAARYSATPPATPPWRAAAGRARRRNPARSWACRATRSATCGNARWWERRVG